MAISRREDVTGLLLAWGGGEESALGRLTPAVYRELRRLAHRHMCGERRDATLQTTALVNEAYLRLVDSRRVRWRDRDHFFALASRLMRRILVDFARSRRALKRGAGARPVSLDEGRLGGAEADEDLVALDEALRALAAVDPRKSRVVELRFFGGLSVRETATALGVSGDTVLREWRLAKVWLMRELTGGKGRGR
jgi:RNA polymerase sigma factor (TIGR02999 family)